ncbi:DJ-1/PfpI family protein [Vibrio fortis]|uniref:DJ-1/PfpI family protein n=1 Tax=Vibrio fortis TaxID=212667 RepID=A0A5N3S8Y1_9VIBR|nr:DJ-1/PfpI family protein [Vibrio fortis]KAB0303280.1 DJ-1/PfpI family protein [Vibrio fortis]|tara:strand:- start:3981 stop:4571 length:591 start_codon:yes stop_codon:yes gene_type:complete
MTQRKHVAVLLADGFEEAEAVVFIDLMRRMKIDVDVLSCMKTTELKSYFKTKITAEYTLDAKFSQSYDAVMMPGGPEGTANLTANPQVVAFLKRHIDEKKWVCPLCSSGAKVLAANNLLRNAKYTSGGGFDKNFQDGVCLDEKVVVDQNFISGKGFGTVFEFSFEVAKHLLADSVKDVVWQADHIYFDHWGEHDYS